MKAVIFDSCEIREFSCETELLNSILSCFPYVADDFEGLEECEIPKDREYADLINDFRMLSLLLVKDEAVEIAGLKKLYKNEIPFKECNDKPFSELDKSNYSLMFFPLLTYAKNPSWGLVVKSDDGLSLFFNALKGKWCKNWNYEHDGDSCQLAAALAERLLKPANGKYVHVMAKEWIVTGKVDENGKVGGIEIGNKLKLKTGRNFIIPNKNSSEISAADRKLHEIFSIDNLDLVQNIIAEEGAKPLPTADFPHDIDEMHILVGESIAPQVASIILAKPKKVILWCSDDGQKSKLPAKCIRRIIELCAENPAFGFEFPEFDTDRELDSASMVNAERTLINYFKEKPNDIREIFFNITSANRMMSYAVQTIARMYSDKVKLIYRDIDSAKSEKGKNADKYFFHILQYSSFPPAYGDICTEVDDTLLNLYKLRNGRIIESPKSDTPKQKQEELSDENFQRLSEEYYKNLLNRQEGKFKEVK